MINIYLSLIDFAYYFNYCSYKSLFHHDQIPYEFWIDCFGDNLHIYFF